MSDSVTASLIELLRCPQSQQRLALMSPDKLAALGLDCGAALVREDGRVCYPVENGFPNLLPDRAIALPVGEEPAPARLDPG
ncbi:MAG: hypothetical protein ACR2OZ_18300 [Verrucomicrobiales bacterium]